MATTRGTSPNDTRGIAPRDVWGSSPPRTASASPQRSPLPPSSVASVCLAQRRATVDFRVLRLPLTTGGWLRATTGDTPRGGGDERGWLGRHEEESIIVMQSLSGFCSASVVSDLLKGAHAS